MNHYHIKMMFDKIGLAITGLALILNIIGVAIPYWFHYSVTEEEDVGSIYFGLWQTCTSTQTKGGAVISQCITFDGYEEFTMPSKFYAARALEILAILATTAAIVVVCLKIFYMKENNRLLYIATHISLLAGLLMIIGAIVFVVDNAAEKLVEQHNMKPHAAFGLCIVSGILSFVASSMFFLAARATSSLR